MRRVGSIVGLLIAAVGATANAGSLTVDELVRCREKVESIYRRHRRAQIGALGPGSVGRAGRGDLRRKVIDSLRKVQALGDLFGHPLRAEQVQREMERMARRTRRPAMLRAVWQALQENPRLIAECFVRPILADRLLRARFASDPGSHQPTRQRAAVDLSLLRRADEMPMMSGRYSERTWVRGKAEPQPGGALVLDSARWKFWLRALAGTFPEMDGLRREPASGQVSRLQEDGRRFYVQAIVEREPGRVRLATVEWAKRSFDVWWRETAPTLDPNDEPSEFLYSLAPISDAAAGSCDDTWLPSSTESFARYGHTAIWTGAEMIVWGGYPLSGGGARYDPSTDTWTPVSTIGAPAGRAGHSAVWTGSEMIVWGGHQEDDQRPLATGGRYDPANDSWLAMSGGAQAQTGHHVAWTGSQMIVWGSAFQPSNKGQIYSPVGDYWRSMSSLGAPSARWGAVSAWTGSEFIVWGGRRWDGVDLNEGKRYDPVRDLWVGALTAPILGRRHSSAVWTGSTLIVWGGVSNAGYHSDGARYSPGTQSWTVISSSDAPAPRANHHAVWSGTEMIVWGGGELWSSGAKYDGGGRYNPVTRTWIPLGSAGAPAAAEGATALWTGDEMIVWGGCAASACPTRSGARYDPANDSWAATGDAPGLASAPATRQRHTAVWTGSEMIVWGGMGPNMTLGDGSRYDPTTDSWTPTRTLGAPSARYDHVAVWTGREMIVWGGRRFSDTLTDGARYDPVADVWTPTSNEGAPPRGEDMVAIWTGAQMVVFGGPWILGGRYDPWSDRWSGMYLGGAPRAQRGHTAIWTGREMIIWGGETPTGYSSFGASYDPLANRWRSLSDDGAPEGRSRHSAVWTGAEMIVWGGRASYTSGSGNLKFLGDGARYDPEARTWTPLPSAGAPEARAGHNAVWTGAEMVVWGGARFNTPFGTGARFDPSSDSWRATTLEDAPQARELHTTVWTGTEMIVWGGNHSTVAKPGRYCAATPPLGSPPVALDAALTTDEDQPVDLTLAGTDADGDTLRFYLLSMPEFGFLTGTAPNLRYRPSANFNGQDRFRFRVGDGHFYSQTAVVTITVRPVDDVPQIAFGVHLATEDTSATYSLTAVDVDGDPLSYRIVSGPTHGTATVRGTELEYTPHGDYNGDDSLDLVANDGRSDSNVATFRVQVQPVNDAPVPDDLHLVTYEEEPLAVSLSAFDADGDGLQFAIVSGPSHGWLGYRGPGEYVYEAQKEYAGMDSFQFRVSDGKAFADGVVQIEVRPVNDIPVAEDRKLSVDEDTSVEVWMKAWDAEGDPLTFRVVTPPAHGELIGAAPNVTYVPAPNFHGEDSFAYVANDGENDSKLATVRLFVLPVNDPPDCSRAAATPMNAWPPDLRMVPTAVSGVTDIDGDVVTTIVTAISYSEPGAGAGHGDLEPDFTLSPLAVRAQRRGAGQRVYTIDFEATDPAGASCHGTVAVCVSVPGTPCEPNAPSPGGSDP